mgnify:CR=1 FL=1
MNFWRRKLRHHRNLRRLRDDLDMEHETPEQTTPEETAEKTPVKNLETIKEVTEESDQESE